MKEKDLYQFCRYYKGQKESPYKDDDARFTAWKIERLWVGAMTDDSDVIENSLDDYLRHGMADYRNMDDTPITLKAFLMNRYFQYNEREDIKGFKVFYEKLYS